MVAGGNVGKEMYFAHITLIAPRASLHCTTFGSVYIKAIDPTRISMN